MPNQAGVAMKKEMIFELYRLYRDETHINFNHHRSTLQNYLAFSATILGFTIAAIIQMLDEGVVILFILTIPALNILVCRLAINMCNRFYSSALERIMLSAKLEIVLDFDKNLNARTSKLFPKDETFLPKRWKIDAAQFETSALFVNELTNKGVNKIARQTFNLLIGLNIILMGVIIYIALL